MSLQEKLESLKEVTLSKIKESRSINELNQIRVDVLGKKGPITEVLRGMKELSAEKSAAMPMRSGMRLHKRLRKQKLH